MATRVRCHKCFKIIECSPYDTSILLRHIKTDHPEIILPEDAKMYFDETCPSRRNHESPERTNSPPRVQLPNDTGALMEDSFRTPGRKPIYTRKYKVNSPITPPRSPQKRRLYRTSVEKWRAGKGTIYCPKCGANKRPIIRSRSEKLSYSTAGAACILTCWPLCFLPCLFSPPPKDYLHCAECNNFLGMYDKQNNCLRPNREFIDAGACKSCPIDKTSENQSERPSSKPLTRDSPEELE